MHSFYEILELFGNPGPTVRQSFRNPKANSPQV